MCAGEKEWYMTILKNPVWLLYAPTVEDAERYLQELMSMTNSREKGKRGERQARDYWREHIGVQSARRGQQYKGGGDSGDLAGIPIFHPEVKVGKQVPKWIYKSLNQCENDCHGDGLPIVQCKRDREEWVFILPDYVFEELVNYYLWGKKDGVG